MSKMTQDLKTRLTWKGGETQVLFVGFGQSYSNLCRLLHSSPCSRKLSSQNLSGAFGFPTTSHHSSSAETKDERDC